MSNTYLLSFSPFQNQCSHEVPIPPQVHREHKSVSFPLWLLPLLQFIYCKKLINVLNKTTFTIYWHF